MKRFGLFHKSFILLVCLLLFAVATPAFGGQLAAPDTGGIVFAMDDRGGDVLASTSIHIVADYEGYISPAIYKAPFIVQHRSGIASARYGKIKARAPDQIMILASLKGKKLIKSGSHFDGLSPGPLISV